MNYIPTDIAIKTACSYCQDKDICPTSEVKTVCNQIEELNKNSITINQCLSSTPDIDPCVYEEQATYENVTITVLKCNRCGHTTITWKRQPNTNQVQNNDK